MLTIAAVAFFLNSLMAPKNPSSEVVLGFPSHSSSCLLDQPFIGVYKRVYILGDEVGRGINVKGDFGVDKLFLRRSLDLV
jgi:hypothetical protein